MGNGGVGAFSGGFVALGFGLWSLHKIDNQNNTPLQRGHGLSIPKGWSTFRDSDGSWKYIDRSGRVYDEFQNPWDIESQKGALTERNFRNNLKMFTGGFGFGKDAHHIFPQNQNFRDFF
jgi:hypothetical protein